MKALPPMNSTTIPIVPPLAKSGIMPEGYQQAHTILSQAKTVFITAHVGPDGDTLGSMLGLKHSLPALFPQLQRVDCIIAGKMPDVFRFMPGIDTVVSIDQTPKALLATYDVAISVDCGALSRLGPATVALFEKASHTLNIDHHVSNDGFAQVNIIETDAAASGEVIYNILMAWGATLNKETAIALYVALLTDTGGFRHSSTTPHAFEVAAALQRAGADVTHIFHEIYETRPFVQLQLMAHVLSEAKRNEAGTLIWATLSLKDRQSFQALDEHTEGIIDELRRVQGVKIAALVKEMESGKTKISLRTNSDAIDVSDLLAREFGGGGHRKAAGATSTHSMEDTLTQLLQAMEKAL
jgi:bifunctional oligoribonuclease and PAP phosphatase NrnA